MHYDTLLRSKVARHVLCLRHRAARLTSLVGLVRAQPRTRSSRAVPTMLVPSMSPAQGHMQVCVIVRAPGAARGADSLRTYSGNMPGLAAGYGRAPGHAHLEMGSAATSSRARDGRELLRRWHRTERAAETPHCEAAVGKVMFPYSYLLAACAC